MIDAIVMAVGDQKSTDSHEQTRDAEEPERGSHGSKRSNCQY